MQQLAVKTDGVYLDGTFGRGGHSRDILAALGPGGRLLAMDRDPEAVAAGREFASHDSRFSIDHERIARLGDCVARHGLRGQLDGLLLDLGVSSPQLEDPARGFSFQHDGPLDMRMDPTAGRSAAEWLNDASEAEIRRVLFRYGEETAAPRIAPAICAHRERAPLERTRELAELVAAVVPARRSDRHPATKTFQAIRIHVNRELEELQAALEQSLDALAPGGRLCVISFHSLEDRIVKRFLRDQSRTDPALARLPAVPPEALPKLRLPARAIRADRDEIDANPRSRSATLRVAERLQ